MDDQRDIPDTPLYEATPAAAALMGGSPNSGVGAGLSFEPEPISPYDPNDAGNKRGFILLGITFAALLLLAVLVMNLWSDGARTRDVPPIIPGSAEFKVVPDAPGGVDTSNQGREVYGRIDGSAAPEVEPRPAPEEPIQVATTAPAAPLPDAVEIEVAPAVPVRPEPTPEPTPEPAPEAVVQAPAARPAAPRPTPAPRPAATTSGWVVQLAALGSQAEADQTWNRFSSRFASTLPAGVSKDVQFATVNGRDYHRLRAAGFGSKADADRFCATLKAQDQACLVRKA